MVSKANLLANACDGGDDGDGDFSPFNVDIGDRGYPPIITPCSVSYGSQAPSPPSPPSPNPVRFEAVSGKHRATGLSLNNVPDPIDEGEPDSEF